MGGVLSAAPGPPLTADETRGILRSFLATTQLQELQKNRSVDLCFSREGIGRFRANVHHQRGTLSGSFRLLPRKSRRWSPCTCPRAA